LNKLNIPPQGIKIAQNAIVKYNFWKNLIVLPLDESETVIDRLQV